MIIVKSPREIEFMREACRITAGARTVARQAIAAGVATREIDREVHKFILRSGATPSFLNYGGFPASTCISVNEEVVHGFPGARKVREGDIVSVDVGAKVTRQSFFEGIKFARPGYRISDIGHAIQEYVESHGFAVVREYEGHGVGAKLHEDPEIPNFGAPGHGPRLVKGMTLAIEPMVTAGDWKVRVLDNDWTAVTIDGSLAAHYENTILITDGEPEILTTAEDL